MFCEKCGSMMFPKDGKYICRNPDCKNEKEIGAKTDAEKQTQRIIDGPTGGDVALIDSDTESVTLPKARVICPSCGNTEAYYTIMQTRSADEPPTTQYRCCKCSNSWREY